MGVIETVSANLSESYTALMSTLPPFAETFITLFLLVVIIVVYTVFIWKFYRFTATKNILGLNLSQYNHSDHPFFAKVIAVSLYFIEYVIVLPFLIFFWFSIFTLFLIILTENLELTTILIISTTIIASIRMTAYYNEDISKELAKILPLTLLAVSILNPGFFDLNRVIMQLNQLVGFGSQILVYFVFIIVLEVILRFFESVFSLFE